MHAVGQGPTVLEPMWESHRDSVRRLLIALGRDIDLADDLLQETYLRARAGISSYRGGNPHAWLTAIAKNVFRTHVRQRYVRAEIPLDSHHRADSPAPACHRLDLLAIRQAITALAPALRTALIMKHYGGFTYQEIASHMRSPVGTAKWRVSAALNTLRAALQAERRKVMVECTGPDQISIVDYVYGLLQDEAAANMNTHLAECASCREQAEALRQVASMLDALEGDHRMMHLVELDQEGGVTLYVTWSHVNTSKEPMSTHRFESEKHCTLCHLSQDGADAPFEKRQCETNEDHWEYIVTLDHPVPAGQRVHLLSVYRFEREGAVQDLGGTRSRFQWKQGPGSNETAYVQAVRLPAGAHLVSADPAPAETRSNAATTLIWRTVIPPHQFFECTVQYELRV